MIHRLKIEDTYLKRLTSGVKKSEIRFNDRDYQLGDVLEFYNRPAEPLVGDPYFYVKFKITHIHSAFGMDEGYVCLSVERVK